MKIISLEPPSGPTPHQVTAVGSSIISDMGGCWGGMDLLRRSVPMPSNVYGSNKCHLPGGGEAGGVGRGRGAGPGQDGRPTRSMCLVAVPARWLDGLAVLTHGFLARLCVVAAYKGSTCSPPPGAVLHEHLMSRS